MQPYRVHLVGPPGQPITPPSVLSADCDSEALQLVIPMITREAGAEVWQGLRLVCRLPRKPERNARGRTGAERKLEVLLSGVDEYWSGQTQSEKVLG